MHYLFHWYLDFWNIFFLSIISFAVLPFTISDVIFLISWQYYLLLFLSIIVYNSYSHSVFTGVYCVPKCILSYLCCYLFCTEVSIYYFYTFYNQSAVVLIFFPLMFQSFWAFSGTGMSFRMNKVPCYLILSRLVSSRLVSSRLVSSG